MIDPVQAVLLFVIVLLTILFVVLGVQIFFILKDLRQTLSRTNRILDSFEAISESIAEPVVNLSSMFGSASSLGAIAKILSFFKKAKKKE